MTWGLGSYGLGPYGGGIAPTILGVSTPWPGAQLDVLGGDILVVTGTNFAAPMTCELLSGVGPSYVVEGEGYMFDARYDLKKSIAYYGSPALREGIYHVRLANPSGSFVLHDAVAYVIVAHELKPDRVRSAYATPWQVGNRYLSTGA